MTYQTPVATSSGIVFAGDDVGGIQIPHVRIVFGPTGVAQNITASNVGLPVAQQGSWVFSVSAGTATIGTVNINSIPAGTATIGNVNISGSLPAGTATLGVVGLSSGVVLVAGTATVGTFALQAAAAVALNAGTATVGTVNVGGSLPAGTATIGVVGLSSGVVLAGGTATIGTVNDAGYVAPVVAGNTRGPLTLAVTASGTVTLVSGVAGQSIYVTGLSGSNRGATVRVAFGPTGDLRHAMNMASGGGGFVERFYPHWRLATGARLVAVTTDPITADLNVQFYIQ